MLFPDIVVVIRGGGDVATGAAVRLMRAGFPTAITELPQPLAVRRAVAFSSAVLSGAIEVEGIRAQRVQMPEEARALSAQSVIPILIDPAGDSIAALNPQIVVDARMTKARSSMKRGDVPLIIGLGPGFTAGVDCDAVVETNRGHFLGRVYWNGPAEPDTGTPDLVQGHSRVRVLRAPVEGIVRCQREIGASVEAGELIATVAAQPVMASFKGVLRGIIADGTHVSAGTKIGDIDPRGRREYCFTISDKSLAIGGGVLEAVLMWLNQTRPRSRT